MTLASTNAAAQLGEPGPEIWADGPLDVKPGNDPRQPDAAVDHRGRRIFVWDSNGGTGTSQEAFLRVFDSDGTSLVGPVQVNTYDTATQDHARVAVQADGSFLVIWQSGEPPMPGDNFERRMVRSQAYDADGQKVGAEQLLSTLQSLMATDIAANVAALAGGGYVVVWQSAQTNGADAGNSIQGRRVNANGTPNGDQFQVNSDNSSTAEVDCDVAPLADGGFIATWGFFRDIRARRFAADGMPVGNDFVVSTITLNVLRDETAVATADDGRVLVVWTDVDEDDNDTEIRGRLLSSTAVPQGSDFRINSLITGAQDWPKVAGYGGNFFVVWQSEFSVGPDGAPFSIEGRLVSGADAFASSQFLVNQWTDLSQGFPGMGGKDGLVAIAWRSQSNSETAQNVIQGGVWSVCGIFCDGFE